jgi:hypothetical protein
MASPHPSPRPAARPRWWHTIEEPRPPEFSPKSLGGNQILLATWICPVFGYKVDRRNLHDLALDGMLWIVKSPRRQHCLVHFRDQDKEKYAAANARRLDFEQKAT